MIFFLNIFSSLAVIIYSIIAYLQYRQSGKQHRDKLQIEALAKQKTDFMDWLRDYLRLSYLLLRETLKADMDALEVVGLKGEKRRRLIILQEVEKRKFKDIQHNLDFKVLSLNMITDERDDRERNMQEAISKHHEQVVSHIQGFTKYVYRELIPEMSDVKNIAEKQEILNKGRERSAETRKKINQANHELSLMVKQDMHQIADQIEAFYK